MTSLPESLTDPFRTQQESPPRLRASDADREVVVQALLDAIARGLLTLQEGDERVAAAYTARFRDELPRLTADLPPIPSSPPVAPGWRTLALLGWLQLRAAVGGVWRGARGAFRSRPRLAVAAVALLALVSLIAATSGEGLGQGGHGGHGVYSEDGWHDHDHDHDHDDDDDDDDD